MDAAAAWAWLRSELPDETANFRFDDDDGHALGSLLAWAKADETITAFDDKCRPLQLTRSEDALAGPINVHTTVTGSTKTVSGESISFGRSVTLTCGFDRSYERKGGAWSLTQESATGCDSSLGHRLSKVSATTPPRTTRSTPKSRFTAARETIAFNTAPMAPRERAPRATGSRSTFRRAREPSSNRTRR